MPCFSDPTSNITSAITTFQSQSSVTIDDQHPTYFTMTGVFPNSPSVTATSVFGNVGTYLNSSTSWEIQLRDDQVLEPKTACSEFPIDGCGFNICQYDISYEDLFNNYAIPVVNNTIDFTIASFIVVKDTNDRLPVWSHGKRIVIPDEGVVTVNQIAKQLTTEASVTDYFCSKGSEEPECTLESRIRVITPDSLANVTVDGAKECVCGCTLQAGDGDSPWYQCDISVTVPNYDEQADCQQQESDENEECIRNFPSYTNSIDLCFNSAGTTKSNEFSWTVPAFITRENDQEVEVVPVGSMSTDKPYYQYKSVITVSVVFSEFAEPFHFSAELQELYICDESQFDDDNCKDDPNKMVYFDIVQTINDLVYFDDGMWQKEYKINTPPIMRAMIQAKYKYTLTHNRRRRRFLLSTGGSKQITASSTYEVAESEKEESAAAGYGLLSALLVASFAAIF